MTKRVISARFLRTKERISGREALRRFRAACSISKDWFSVQKMFCSIRPISRSLGRARQREEVSQQAFGHRLQRQRRFRQPQMQLLYKRSWQQERMSRLTRRAIAEALLLMGERSRSQALSLGLRMRFSR